MRVLSILLFINFSFFSFSQDSLHLKKTTVDYNLGQGLDINVNDNKFQFKIRGIINPYFEQKIDLKSNQTKNSSLLHMGAARLVIEGGALNKRIVYKFDLNFIDSRPLLGAWFGYNVFKYDSKQQLLISAGQKRTSTNSREGYFDEPNAALQDRSVLSSLFANSGREVGLFVEGSFLLADYFGIRPSLALTSGDGRSYFNSGESNPDSGGMKVGGRLDLLFGKFKEGNYYSGIDLAHEEKPKFAIGAAYSYNQGASDAKGDDHMTISLYDGNFSPRFASYTKFYADLLFKWKGITLMGEYVLSNVTNDTDVFEIIQGPSPILTPYNKDRNYVLGSAFNATLGYAFKKHRLTIDTRYTQTTPRLSPSTGSSLLSPLKQYTVGVAKYFLNNDALKIQLVGNYTTVDGNVSTNYLDEYFTGQVIVQLMF